MPRSQQPSPSMGEGLGGGDCAAAKTDIRSQQAAFCFKEIFMLVPALTNGPDFRHSRVASGDLADITPIQPSSIYGGGLQDVWHCGNLSFAFLAQFYNCILKT
jgi:hypothetical protein